MGRALKLNNALVKLSFDGSFDLPIPQLQGREGVGSTEDASVEDINLKSKKCVAPLRSLTATVDSRME